MQMDRARIARDQFERKVIESIQFQKALETKQEAIENGFDFESWEFTHCRDCWYKFEKCTCK